MSRACVNLQSASVTLQTALVHRRPTAIWTRPRLFLVSTKLNITNVLVVNSTLSLFNSFLHTNSKVTSLVWCVLTNPCFHLVLSRTYLKMGPYRRPIIIAYHVYTLDQCYNMPYPPGGPSGGGGWARHSSHH